MKRRKLLAAILLPLSLGCAGTLGQTCAQPPIGIADWWPGEGNLLPCGNYGSLAGNSNYTAGNSGLAFNFDGNSSLVLLSKIHLR